MERFKIVVQKKGNPNPIKIIYTDEIPMLVAGKGYYVQQPATQGQYLFHKDLDVTITEDETLIPEEELKTISMKELEAKK
jgi:hypothetical protein